MAVIRHPYGYKKDVNGVMGMGTLLTRVEMERMTTVRQLHHEFWRRAIALFEFGAQKGFPLGVGGGWRVQPNPPPPGFAQPGNSNHEGFPADGRAGGAVAIDTVPNVSWDWMEANCAAYGLRTFRHVNDEPWHIQPVEIPAARSWRTTPWELARWALPGDDDSRPPVTLEEKPVFINRVDKDTFEIGDRVQKRTVNAGAATAVINRSEAAGVPLFNWDTGESVLRLVDVTGDGRAPALGKLVD